MFPVGNQASHHLYTTQDPHWWLCTFTQGPKLAANLHDETHMPLTFDNFIVRLHWKLSASSHIGKQAHECHCVLSIAIFYNNSHHNRSTRVTMNTCTRIDNIFTNHYDVRENQLHGILKTDITDHFPLFYINCRKSPSSSDDDYKLIRIMKSEQHNMCLKFKLWIGPFWTHLVTVNLILLIS